MTFTPKNNNISSKSLYPIGSKEYIHVFEVGYYNSLYTNINRSWSLKFECPTLVYYKTCNEKKKKIPR